MQRKIQLRKKYYYLRKKKYFEINKDFFLPLIQLIKSNFKKKRLSLALYYPTNFELNVIKILEKYPNHCSLFDTALVSINDELVNLFLSKKISFQDIFKYLLHFLNLRSIQKLKKIIPKNYMEISNINEFVRLKIKNLSI